jgi:polysaccharide biosynthesis/export protein
MRLISCAIVFVLGLVVAPLAHAEGSPPVNGTDTVALDEYRIGAEDTLQIAVWRNEAMSKTIPVRPDGMISLPLLNEVKAAGLTPAELRQVIATKLSEYMPTPEVSVIVTDVKSFKVSIIGEVRRPARYELKSSTTILDVLALAGGLTEFAAKGRIVVLRQNGKGVKSIQFNYNKMVTAGSEQENFYMRPGDVVLVP